MVVMLGGMVVAFFVIVQGCPAICRSGTRSKSRGALGKMNAVDLSPSLGSRYTFWSGLAGGFFLAMSYFGTDQSQVQRYLSGRSVTESRLGLLFNGLVQGPDAVPDPVRRRDGVRLLPVQPAAAVLQRAGAAPRGGDRRAPRLQALESQHRVAFEHKRAEVQRLVAALDAGGREEIAAAEARVRTAAADATACATKPAR